MCGLQSPGRATAQVGAGMWRRSQRQVSGWGKVASARNDPLLARPEGWSPVRGGRGGKSATYSFHKESPAKTPLRTMSRGPHRGQRVGQTLQYTSRGGQAPADILARSSSLAAAVRPQHVHDAQTQGRSPHMLLRGGGGGGRSGTRSTPHATHDGTVRMDRWEARGRGPSARTTVHDSKVAVARRLLWT